MSSSKLTLNAFRRDYPGIVRELVTRVFCFPREVSENPVRLQDVLKSPGQYSLLALWDTGATDSCIKPEAASRVRIANSTIRYTKIRGVNSKSKLSPVYKTGALILPKNAVFPGKDLIGAEIAHRDADILIGMDIISQGDLAISNGEGATTFCFSFPPAPNPIDLAERAEKINSRKKQPPKIRN